MVIIIDYNQKQLKNWKKLLFTLNKEQNQYKFA